MIFLMHGQRSEGPDAFDIFGDDVSSCAAGVEDDVVAFEEG